MNAGQGFSGCGMPRGRATFVRLWRHGEASELLGDTGLVLFTFAPECFLFLFSDVFARPRELRV